jgi:magnesium transporter
MIAAVVYSRDGGVERYEDLAAARAAAGTTWVRVTETTRPELDRVADAFGVHPLVVEDVLTDVRPKTEAFGGYVFTLLKDAELRTGDGSTFAEEVRSVPIGVVVGSDWVLTLSTDAIDAVGRVWSAVERGDERLLQRGPDFTAYRVIEVVVDEYFEILDRIETGIERIEEEVLVSTDIETLDAINTVRRDLLAFRKLAWPTREAVGLLARGDVDQVDTYTEKYYRDVYDSLVQVVDLIETYRDLARGARDIYLNTVSQSTNEVMKVLTVIATVFLPLTFVAGVYGMNFDPASSPYNMPELGWTFGYPAVMLGMAALSLLMLGYFRRQGYL